MVRELVKTVVRMYFRAKGHFPATIRGNKFKLDPYHFAFWRAVAKDRWEPSTFDVIEKFAGPDSTYIDIGAWIGPTVLHASKRYAKIYCFEPDPTALRFLNWNLDLNEIRNVSSLGVAIAASSGLLKMASFGDKLGDSQTSLLNTDAEHSIEVLVIAWAEFIERAKPKNVSLLKVDVEGAEFDLISTMTDYLKAERPALFLSTHAPFLEPNQRQAAMENIHKALSFYPKVYDGFLNPIDRKELLSEKASEEFGEYLFTF